MIELFLITSLIVSGYYFISNFYITKIEINNSEGNKLHYKSFFAGTIIVVFSALVLDIIISTKVSNHCNSMDYSFFYCLICKFVSLNSHPIKFNFINIFLLCFCSLSIGWISPRFFNWLLSKKFLRKHYLKLYENVISDDFFENIFLDSCLYNRPIMINLKSGKVYVGVVSNPFDFDGKRTQLKFIPELSGYRDDNREVEFTTNYTRLYSEIEIIKNKIENSEDVSEEDVRLAGVTKSYFSITIDFKEIFQVSFFDYRSYLKFQKYKCEQTK